jgi:hypothetical protein
MQNHKSRLLLFISLLLPLRAIANQNAQGWCENRAQLVVTSRIGSTTQDQGSYPQCTVAVYVHGGGLAVRCADRANTPLMYPFSANSNGRWLFCDGNGHYHIYFSGNGFPIPATYADIVLSDASTVYSCDRVVQNNSVVLSQQSKLNFFSPITCLNNDGKSCGDSTVSGGDGGVSSPYTSQNPILPNVENHIQGPDPYVDIRNYGARNIPYPNTPLVTTCSITSGSGTMTLDLNTGSQILNGDSVRCDGAGPATSLTTPTGLTVSPYVNAGGSTSAPFTGPSTGSRAIN